MNKRGASSDILYMAVFGIVMVVIIILAIVVSQKMNGFVTGMQGVPTTLKGQIDYQQTTGLVNTADWWGVAIIVAMGLVIIMSAWLTRINPVFAIIGILVWLVSLIAGGSVANAAISFISGSGDAESAVTSMPLTNWFLQHWMISMIIIGALALVAGFAKPGGGD